MWGPIGMAEEEADPGADAQVSIFQALGADDPEQLGDYTLAARLGAGGMGKVYLSHTLAGRPVAIKAIRPELADDPGFRRRFRREVAAARRVHGLYTAPVIDSEIDTTPLWLATAFVQGPTLSAAVSRHGTLPTSAVLLLAAGVAEALQAVHGEGIVHRDLKASNVLLAMDGPRVIDFGIARAVDSTALTNTGVAVGTPSFMSPEQALNKDVGPATDIFSLGQLVTYAAKSTPAFGEGQTYGVLYRIVHEEPDLDGVPEVLLPLLHRCLTKDPDKRPSLAEVIGLCRAASEGGILRRSGNWLPDAITADITRHQDVPEQGATCHQLGLAGVAKVPEGTQTQLPESPTSSGSLGSPELNDDAAADADADAETGAGVEGETGTGNGAGAETRTGAGVRADTGSSSGTEGGSGADHGPDAKTGAGSPTSAPPPALSASHSDADNAGHPPSEASPPGPRKSTPPEGMAAEAPEAPEAPEPVSPTYRAASVPSAQRNTVGGHSSGQPTSKGKTKASRERSTPTAGNAGQPPPANTPQPDRKPIRRRALLTLGATLLAGAAGTTAVIGLREDGDDKNPKDATPKEIAVTSTATFTGHKVQVYGVAFSPDGETLATASDDEVVILWNVETQNRAATLTGHKHSVTAVAFSPDGKTLATACGDETVILWNVETRDRAATLNGHKNPVNRVVFSPDGKTLAAASGVGVVILWNVETRDRAATLDGHEYAVNGVVFSPDGRILATASEDGKVILWNVETRDRAVTLTGHEDCVNGVAFSPDGKTLATASDDKTARLWKASGNARISAAQIES